MHVRRGLSPRRRQLLLRPCQPAPVDLLLLGQRVCRAGGAPVFHDVRGPGPGPKGPGRAPACPAPPGGQGAAAPFGVERDVPADHGADCGAGTESADRADSCQ